MYDCVVNVKSFTFCDNELYASFAKYPDIEGELFDVVDEHCVSFTEKSGVITLCSSSNHRAKQVFCQPISASSSSSFQVPHLLKQQISRNNVLWSRGERPPS